MDKTYWEVIQKEGMGEDMLDDATQAIKDRVVREKREQFKEYWAEKRDPQSLNHSNKTFCHVFL